MRRGRVVHLLFAISVIGKGVDGLLEIVGGILLLAVSPAAVGRLVRILTQHELSEDPRDVVAGYLLRSTRHLSAGAKTFGAIYLLGHGLVKMGLVTALLHKRPWAYPAAIAAFALFVAYQIYRYSLTRSAALLALSVADLALIGLTWLEYRRLREPGSTPAS